MLQVNRKNSCDVPAARGADCESSSLYMRGVFIVQYTHNVNKCLLGELAISQRELKRSRIS